MPWNRVVWCISKVEEGWMEATCDFSDPDHYSVRRQNKKGNEASRSATSEGSASSIDSFDFDIYDEMASVVPNAQQLYRMTRPEFLSARLDTSNLLT
jgi:hypothetical protein